MAFMPPSSLAPAMAFKAAFRADSATVERTSAVVNCRVSDGKGEFPVKGLPSGISVRKWLLRLPLGLDLDVGDRIVVAGRGTYAVCELLVPLTMALETKAFAAQLIPTHDGLGTLLPFPTNADVTFINPLATGGVGPITTRAYVYPADADVVMYGLDPALKWGVLFDPTLAYSDERLIGADDQIRLGPVLGVKTGGMARSAALTPPRRTLGPLQIATAYFKEGD